ncbi:AAA family ATPase [Alkalibacillus silvisoli]|uniref:DNA topology modulation protein n=1 Tax=Alkalibacillus silvisoli TaxID=392823 RepID=A0ABN0ZMR1_9BACI
MSGRMNGLNRILIVGSSGAGKSKLSSQLGELLNIRVIHLDSLFWLPNWTQRDLEEWQQLNREIVKGNQWIIDGYYPSTLEIRMQHADTIIYLNYPRRVCLYRAIKRRFEYRGVTRPDMGEGCPERLHVEFLQYIWKFPEKEKPLLEDKLNQVVGHIKVIELNSPKDAKVLLDNLTKQDV